MLQHYGAGYPARANQQGRSRRARTRTGEKLGASPPFFLWCSRSPVPSPFTRAAQARSGQKMKWRGEKRCKAHHKITLLLTGLVDGSTFSILFKQDVTRPGLALTLTVCSFYNCGIL